MANSTLMSILRSWSHHDCCVETTESILEWIADRNKATAVDIRKTALSQSPFWFYNEQQGRIQNRNNSFFQIAGLEQIVGNRTIIRQPVILQQEIGFLGIICQGSMA